MSIVQDVKRNTGLEKHVQTLLLSLITAGIIGAYVKVTDISDRLIRIETREEQKMEEFKKLEVEIRRIQLDILSLKERINKLENK